eukprot:scaffold64944_cov18-Phaeocystis_antarctica.AAC.1
MGRAWGRGARKRGDGRSDPYPGCMAWRTERKKMPGTAAGTVRLSTAMVSSEMRSGVALGPSRPFLTMLGLSTERRG